jgi:translocation and assembly module TamA
MNKRIPWRRLAAVVPLASLAACAGDDFGEPLDFAPPETALEYEVALEGAPSEEVAELLEESLTLYRRQEDGAQSLAFLRRRARQDVETAQDVLRSFGWYAAEIETEVAGGVDADRAEALRGLGEDPPPAMVAFRIAPGPRFTLTAHDFTFLDPGATPPPALAPSEMGSPVGGPAVAAEILDAEAAAVSALREAGRPYAEFVRRDAVADLEASSIAVDSAIFAGPVYRYGPMTFEGLEDVERDYLETYRTFRPGGVWSPAELAAFQADLVETDLFDVVRVAPPEDPPPGEVAPVIVTLEERPKRTVSAGARYSTDQGPAVRAAYEHRNLLGRNEQLYGEVLVGTEEQAVETRLRKPQFGRDGQDLLAGVLARRIDDEAYEEVAVTGTLGLERELTPRLSVGAGGLLEYSVINDAGEEETFYLAGLPLFADYDGSNDLLNPTEGFRARVDATPFVGRTDDGETPVFTRIDAYGSAYRGLDAEDRYVLAGRARAGSIVAEDVETVPASRRLYSGGGGSVRGYGERDIGPEDEDGDPQGGLSVLEAGVELRAQVYGDFGGVVFVEGGQVSEEPFFAFDEPPRFAAGVGARYYSPVGPLRFDIGFPLNPADDHDAFQFYVSLGQAY